jgi:hypothetical protein
MKTELKSKKIRKVKAATRIKSYDPEKRIMALVRSGAIASAGRNAIAASFKKGLSVTVLENGVIYRLHPDGTRTAIKRLNNTTKTYTSGKMMIG